MKSEVEASGQATPDNGVWLYCKFCGSILEIEVAFEEKVEQLLCSEIANRQTVECVAAVGLRP